jgi:two-component system cell cycle response regulator DivK
MNRLFEVPVARKPQNADPETPRLRGDRRAVPRGGRRRSDQVALAAALERTAAKLHALTRECAPLVLVADESPDGRKAICEYLYARGFRVEDAGSGAETLVKARALRPDLILLDLTLPDIDGFEIMAQLRASPLTNEISIAALAKVAADDIRQRAIKAGALMFIPKPCDLSMLTVFVAAACRLLPPVAQT